MGDENKHLRDEDGLVSMVKSLDSFDDLVEIEIYQPDEDDFQDFEDEFPDEDDRSFCDFCGCALNDDNAPLLGSICYECRGSEPDGF